MRWTPGDSNSNIGRNVYFDRPKRMKNPEQVRIEQHELALWLYSKIMEWEAKYDLAMKARSTSYALTQRAPEHE